MRLNLDKTLRLKKKGFRLVQNHLKEHILDLFLRKLRSKKILILQMRQDKYNYKKNQVSIKGICKYLFSFTAQ